MPVTDPLSRKQISARYWKKNKNRLYAKHKANPKYHAAQRKHLMTRYGITPEQYGMMLMDQDGVCAICKTADPQGKRKFFCVDHNHTTGKVRGLLCQSCNILVAYAEHKRLQEAYSYLQEYDPK